MKKITLGRTASFWTSLAVVGHTIWTSAAPALTYPLYATQWHLSTFETTAIFAVYPLFVVFTLVVFGNISDFIGRRETMIIGVGASLVGAALFSLAPNIIWLFVGRAFMGIGVGLAAGPSAAAVLEFSAPGKESQSGGATAGAQALGMMAAALIGGALIQYAPLPTRLNFIVLTVVLLGLFAATWCLPNFTASRAAGKWRPKSPGIPNGLLLTFTVATASVTASYVLGAITLSLGAQVAHDVVASTNALVNGATIAVFALSMALATLPARRMSAHRIVLSGSVIAILSSAVLAISAADQSLPLYVLAQISAGVAYSLLLLGGLSMLTAQAPVTHRGATLSALFLVAYLAQAVVALALGKAATSFGLGAAVDFGVLAVVILALCTLSFALVAKRIPAAAHAKSRGGR